jgi:N4-(beta-N-acetylglucosaminyl)-L-asparaginase
MAQGVDTLDAAIEGVKIQELDPEDTSVGYGGLPNENGVVEEPELSGLWRESRRPV